MQPQSLCLDYQLPKCLWFFRTYTSPVAHVHILQIQVVATLSPLAWCSCKHDDLSSNATPANVHVLLLHSETSVTPGTTNVLTENDGHQHGYRPHLLKACRMGGIIHRQKHSFFTPKWFRHVLGAFFLRSQSQLACLD